MLRKSFLIFIMVMALTACSKSTFKAPEYLHTSEDLLRDESEVSNISYNLNSQTEDKILDKGKNYLIYKLDKADVKEITNKEEYLKEDPISLFGENNYLLDKETLDLRIRDIQYMRLDKDSPSKDTIRIITDQIDGFGLWRAISEDNIAFMSVEGVTSYGNETRENPQSIFGKTIKYLVFKNYSNADFSPEDRLVFEIPGFEVKELDDDKKYQDGKIIQFFETDYIDPNTVIQYY